MSDILVGNLNFGYDKNLIFKGINLQYDCKDFLAIIGPNGGGKSTLLKLLLGLHKPISGKIEIFNKRPNEVAKFIGYVPQLIELNKSFPVRVLDVVLMGRIDKKIFGFYSKDDKKQALEALSRVEMSEFAYTKISDLSGGQRQRVYIARALCARTKILMLDEPTASIDTKGQADIYRLLKSINEQGIGIVLISHDVNLTLSFATKAAYVNRDLFMHEISQNAKHDFIEHLATKHKHFCDIEMALGCECANKEKYA